MQLSGVVKWIESIITYLYIYNIIYIIYIYSIYIYYIHIYIFILCNYVFTNLTNDGIVYYATSLCYYMF